MDWTIKLWDVPTGRNTANLKNYTGSIQAIAFSPDGKTLASGSEDQAINLWDSNAAKGIPSKGLLQVIDPTFQSYHVNGTSWNIYDPVANITAACNYAFHVYGSMDNVNSAY